MNYGKYTYSEIAKELGISRERVRQVERRALQKLEQRFRQLGYDERFFYDLETEIFQALSEFWNRLGAPASSKGKGAQTDTDPLFLSHCWASFLGSVEHVVCQCILQSTKYLGALWRIK